jgi:hypothetical protein
VRRRGTGLFSAAVVAFGGIACRHHQGRRAWRRGGQVSLPAGNRPGATERLRRRLRAPAARSRRRVRTLDARTSTSSQCAGALRYSGHRGR